MPLTRDQIEQMTAIPETRAKIIRYTRRMPFSDGGSVWSSTDKATIPVYEETKPYDKLPAEIRNKEFRQITLFETLLFALAADRADRAIDKLIYYKVFLDARLAHDRKFGTNTYLSECGGERSYTHSLDAAVSLYVDKPDEIPSDPLHVVCAALEQRVLLAQAMMPA